MPIVLSIIWANLGHWSEGPNGGSGAKKSASLEDTRRWVQEPGARFDNLDSSDMLVSSYVTSFCGRWGLVSEHPNTSLHEFSE